MKKLLLATVSSFALVGAASAADMALKAAPLARVVSNWTGCYIGVHGAVVSARTGLQRCR